MTYDFDLIVVGGGLAGLAAGATARRAGASAVVLEAHSPGGRARTATRDGFVFNHGAHALYVGGPGMGVLRDLGVEPVGVRPPLEDYKLLLNGRLHQLPASPSTLLRTTALGTRSKAQLGKLLALLPRFDARSFAGISASEWFADKDLRPDAEAVMRALARISTYCDDFDDIGADAVISQLQFAAKAGVLYLDRGWDQLVDGLAAQVEVRSHTTVTTLDAGAGGVRVETSAGSLTARSVVVALATPDAARALLPGDPGWRDLGEPVTVACLDVAAARVPQPGYVLSADQPLYGTMQGPPARQAPEGKAVVAVVRYGARSAAEDRADLEAHLAVTGVGPEDVVHQRFLARMVVTGAQARAMNGGLAGRPAVDATGVPGVYLAGDWVGSDGMLADTSLASGAAAARAALRALDRAPSAA